MATPHVAGAAALVWSWMGQRFVSDAAEDLRAIILDSAERPAFLNGWVGQGMLDGNAMVLKAALLGRKGKVAVQNCQKHQLSFHVGHDVA